MAIEVRIVVRNIIAEHAPEELILLDAAEHLDPAARTRQLTPGGGSRETLGYGLETAAALILPVLWLVLTELARQTAQTAGESAAEGLRGWWRERRRGRAGSAAEDEPVIVPPLSAEQLGLVRQRVLDQCAQAGIGTARATAVANAVFHELSVGTPDTQPEARDE